VDLHAGGTTKLEKIEGGALILLVHGVKQQECIYGEKLDITTSFTYFHGRMGTRYLQCSFATGWRGQLGDSAASKAAGQRGQPCCFFIFSFYFVTRASPPVLDLTVVP